MWTTIFNIFLTPIINAHILYGGTCHFVSDHLILHIASLSWRPSFLLVVVVVVGGGDDVRLTKRRGPGGNRTQRGGGGGGGGELY